MQSIEVAIVGAGQAGLAMSACLSKLGIEHVLFERGAIAERWKTTAWDSLTMLTPNWMNVLPYGAPAGDAPDGFMSRSRFVRYLEAYARENGAPVVAGANVLSVSADGRCYRVLTSAGEMLARALVIATGQCDRPALPAQARLAGGPYSLHSSQYRRERDLPAGGVLVVGASSSGVQIADELRDAGRDVVLSVGRHTSLPRRYRGQDIFVWLARMGILSQGASEVPDLPAALRQPSLQLAGRREGADVGLAALQQKGVRLAGRLAGCSEAEAAFAGDLAETVAAAASRRTRLLRSIDAFAGSADAAAGRRCADSDPDTASAPGSLAFAREGIRTIVWATGFHRSFPWLHLPVLTAAGEIEHRDGITSLPGVYALGYRFLRKRDSNFIGGVGTDAVALSHHVAGFLRQARRQAA